MRGEIFQVELRRCRSVHEGYQNFPAGTTVYWKVKDDGTTIARGSFLAESGRGYHFITQPLGIQLKASPKKYDVHYVWTINGIEYRKLGRYTPGCSGTTATGASGPGNIFVVRLKWCKNLQVGYQHFPESTKVWWRVREGAKTRLGGFVTLPGTSEYHFLTQALGGEPLRPGVDGKIDFLWKIRSTWYHYGIGRPTGC